MTTRNDAMTRRTLFGVVGLGVPGVLLASRINAEADGAPDAVLGVIANELVAVQKRAFADPGNPELAREIASMFRVIDVVANANDLKKHLKKAHHREVDLSMAEQRAQRLRNHGIKASGDDVLRHHFEARAQFTDADSIEKAAVASLQSGHVFQQTAAALEALAAPSGNVANIAFRESLKGPASGARLLTAQDRSRACAWAHTYAARWGFILGETAFLLAMIPPLEPLAVGYAAVSLFFDGAALYCE